jgi:hypothetical protein
MPGVYVRLHMTSPLHIDTTTSILRLRLSVPLLSSIFVFSGPSLTYNGGNECTATLHSSDRDPTPRLHLHFANIFRDYFSKTDNAVNPQITISL